MFSHHLRPLATLCGARVGRITAAPVRLGRAAREQPSEPVGINLRFGRRLGPVERNRPRVYFGAARARANLIGLICHISVVWLAEPESRLAG